MERSFTRHARTSETETYPCHTWASGRPGPARHGHGPARHDGYRAMEARRALRAVPHRPAGLAFGPGTDLWAIFRAVLAREARQK